MRLWFQKTDVGHQVIKPDHEVCVVCVQCHHFESRLKAELWYLTESERRRKMKASLAAVVVLCGHVAAFAPRSSAHKGYSLLMATKQDTPVSVNEIGSMSFRELQNECKSLGLSPEGTTATLRSRLRESIAGPVDPFDHELINAKGPEVSCFVPSIS